ncbi:MAG: hypothetical protein JSR78_09035 [Proteobacteria bacterium]|nr:hypothetical protein [Pseudomonadota bacterium]
MLAISDGLQRLGIIDGQIVLQPVSSSLIDLVGYLAWPLAALLIAILLRKHLLKISEGMLAFNAFVDDKGKLAGLMSQLSETSTQVGATQADLTRFLEGVEQKMERLQKGLSTLHRGVQNLEEQEFSSLTKSVEESIANSSVQVPLLKESIPQDLDARWDGITKAWDDIKAALRRKMDKAGVKGNFQGTSNILAVVTALQQAGAITQGDADLIMPLAKQFSWMYRTTVPASEFLTGEVYGDFLRGSASVASLLA